MNNPDILQDEESVDPFSSYRVVKNINGDYSIWPKEREIPAGWSAGSVEGTKKECLDWIEANWEGPSLKGH